MYVAENRQLEFGSLPALLVSVFRRVDTVVVVILGFAMVALVSMTIASSISAMTRGRRS
jgi:hypothetical protein